jgi:hypothetical protein
MPMNPTARPMNLMRWRLLVQFLLFVLIVDGAVAYLGWLVWKMAVR